ncbi:MAG: hypothetical protein AAGA54_03235 [Myxococcota bacterium]
MNELLREAFDAEPPVDPGAEPDRLSALLADLGASESAAEGLVEPEPEADVFFTRRVLDTLPEPLRFTGLSPRMRAFTLLGFHLAAGVVAVLVFRWASPKLLDAAAKTAANYTSGLATSMELGAGGGAEGMVPAALTVAAVALIAFWATWSHTRAT